MKTLFALASLACLMTLPGCSCESGVPRRDAGGDDIGTDGGGEDSGRDGGGDDGGTCTGASLACGDDCCTSNEFCDPNTVCCAFSAACGDRCCGTDETCIGAVCHIACEPTEVRCSNAEGAEICCGSTQVCASGACFTPVTSCTDFIDCPDGQYCEPSVNGGTCLPQPGGETCQLTPMGSSVVPEVVWQWPTSAGVSLQAPTSDQVMMTPMVANITDDNTDGVIDERDNPDVVFISYVDGSYTQNGILRVVDGTTGDDIWSATDPMQYVAPGGQVAIADIDGDGRPEIVACSANGATTGPLIAFEDTGAIKWIDRKSVV